MCETPSTKYYLSQKCVGGYLSNNYCEEWGSPKRHKKHCQPLLTCLLPVPPGWERQCRGWGGAPPCNPASDCALPPEFSHCYSNTLCWYKHFYRVSSLEIITFIVEPKKAFYDAKLLHYISISTFLHHRVLFYGSQISLPNADL